MSISDHDNCIFTLPITLSTKLQVRCSFAEVLDASNIESACSFWSKAEALSKMTSSNHRNKPWVSLKVILATACIIELNGCWSLIEKCQGILDLTNPLSQLGTASFLILSLWKLNSWTTEAQGVLPNSSSNATRDEQKEKYPLYWEGAEHDEGVNVKEQEQLRWYMTNWTGRQNN